MKILFICSDFPFKKSGSNLYTDLADELVAAGHDISVVVSEEKKKIQKDYIEYDRNFKCLRVKTGNIYEVGFVEKTLSFMRISNYLIKSIKKNLSKEKFDLILFQSPPVTFHKVVKWAMKKYNCNSYLMMKDIFPQNGVDIGLYGHMHPAYLYFRMHEKKLYKTATYIGCMSLGNIKYIKEHNPYLDESKLELFPNTVKITENIILSNNEKLKIREKYGISKDDIVAVYGGNFGKPQGLDFLINVIEQYKNDKKIKFLLIGKGTEKQKIYNLIGEKKLKNVLMYDYIPREDYEKILKACDIGLIFLDKRFTIPNYPSKTLSYFECSLPIMAAIDKSTDYGKDLEKIGAGYWVENGDIEAYKIKMNFLIENQSLRENMGKKGRKHLEKFLNVTQSVKKIESLEKRGE